MRDVMFVDIRAELADELADIYARVFAGPEWFEIEKCAACGRAYPGTLSTRHGFYAEGSPCWDCGKPLGLISYYLDSSDQLARCIILDSLGRADSVALGAVIDNTIVGFSWGYALPRDETPRVNFRRVRESLVRANISLEGLFYLAEFGVVPELQGRGIGKALLKELARRIRVLGYSRVIFQTVDRPRVVGAWCSLLGDAAVAQLPIGEAPSAFYCAHLGALPIDGPE